MCADPGPGWKRKHRLWQCPFVENLTREDMSFKDGTELEERIKRGRGKNKRGEEDDLPPLSEWHGREEGKN